MLHLLKQIVLSLCCCHSCRDGGCATAGRLLVARCVCVFCQQQLKLCLLRVAFASAAAVGFASATDIRHVSVAHEHHSRIDDEFALVMAETSWMQLLTYLLMSCLFECSNGLMNFRGSACHEGGAYCVCSKLTKLP